MIYMRWRKGESRRGRVIPDPGIVGHLPCPSCGESLDVAPPVQYVAVGPDIDSPTNLADFAAGRYCRVQAVILHADCAAHLDDTELETLIHGLEVLDPDG